MKNPFIEKIVSNCKFSNKEAFNFIKDSTGEYETLSYKELGDIASTIANNLQKYIKKDDRVVLMLLPGKEYACSVWGGILSKGVIVPALPPDPAKLKTSLPQLKNILKDSRAKVVITNRFIKKKMFVFRMLVPFIKFLAVEDLMSNNKISIENYTIPETSDESLALLQYTSGSTSNPKGVMTSYKNIGVSADLIFAKMNTDISPAEMTMVSWLPPAHNTGLFVGIILPIFHGANVILISPLTFLTHPLIWLEQISKAKGKIIVSGGPQFAYDLCAKKYTLNRDIYSFNLEKWKLAFVGTEQINNSILDDFTTTFSECGYKKEYFQPSYGLTEQVSVLSGIEMNEKPVVLQLDKDALKQRLIKIVEEGNGANLKTVVSCGKILKNHTVKIINADTKAECNQDHIGEVYISGPTVTLGYWKNDELNKQFFGQKLDGDDLSYFRTGDLGFFHNDEIYIVGRLKEMIIIKGKNYYPVDIERTVEAKCSEVIRGTTVAFAADVNSVESLFIVAETNSQDVEINLQIKQIISSNNNVIPYQVTLVKEGELPRSALSKIQRAKVAQIYSKKTSSFNQSNNKIPPKLATDIKPSNELEEKVVKMIARIIDVRPEKININGPFTSVGMDSLQLVELTLKISGLEKVKLPDDFAWKFQSIREAVNFVLKQEKDENLWSDLTDEGDTLANFGKWVAGQIPQFVNTVSSQDKRNVIINGREIIDFASCNYLSYDLNQDIINSIPPAIEKWGVHPSWTRIVASPEIYLELEEELKELIGAKYLVAFPTATLIHLGVLPVLCGDGGTIFIDSAAHTSIQEGAHLARAKGAKVFTFKHRDINDLEILLKNNPISRRKIIAIDGVYSMSGWWVDLKKYVELAKKYDAYLYVDDAHGFGIIGENPTTDRPFGRRGNGIVKYFGLDYTKDRIIYVSVLSKAYSSIGAFITACNEEMMKLIYTASTIVFTGPIPTASLASALEGVHVNDRIGETLRETLWDRTQELIIGAKEIGFEVNNTTGFPIIFVVMGGIDNVIKGCQILWEHGILITPAVFPGVPLDKGGIRFSVTTENTNEQIEKALEGLREVYKTIFEEK